MGSAGGKQQKSPESKPRYKRPHLRFAAVVAAYTLGGFNENFFKEAAMLIAVGSNRTELQGWATVLFSLPYLLFAAYAGWLSDRFAKKNVMIAAKGCEIVAMGVGAVGLIYMNWGLILAMAWFMATQSSIFSPAVNGMIPEHYPSEKVNRANAVIKIAIMAGILIGVGMAGAVLGGLSKGSGHRGTELVAPIVIAITLVGFALSLFAPWYSPADPKLKFPVRGPLETAKLLWRLRKDRLFKIILFADIYIWGLGSLQLMIINEMGMNQFRYGELMTGLLVVTQLIGFGAGGILSGRLSRGPKWYRVLAPAAAIMGAFLALVAAVPLLPNSIQLPFLILMLLIEGAGGGLLMIPCESFIQLRPKPEEKGEVIAAANSALFAGIMISGPLSNLLNAALPPTISFLIMGVTAFIAAALLRPALSSVEPSSI